MRNYFESLKNMNIKDEVIAAFENKLKTYVEDIKLRSKLPQILLYFFERYFYVYFYNNKGDSKIEKISEDKICIFESCMMFLSNIKQESCKINQIICIAFIRSKLYYIVILAPYLYCNGVDEPCVWL